VIVDERCCLSELWKARVRDEVLNSERRLVPDLQKVFRRERERKIVSRLYEGI